MKDDVLTRLNALLDEDRALLLKGSYAGLPQLAAAKEDCLSALTTAKFGLDDLRAVIARLDSNQCMTSSALRGIAAARARVSDLETVRDRLTTYDPTGKVQVVATPKSRVEKKA